MKFFTDCKTLDELKKEYRRLAMLHHPDRGGDLETMKQINNEHDEMFELLKKKANANAQAGKETTETPEEFRDIINTLLQMDGLNVELCGSWLWISGETKKHKEALKASGCRWSKSKVMWYWRHQEAGAKWHRGKCSIDEIRDKYGSEKIVRGSGLHRIAAAG